jgi:hypothetical protein
MTPDLSSLAHIAGIPVEETFAQLGALGLGVLGTVLVAVRARFRRRADVDHGPATAPAAQDGT